MGFLSLKVVHSGPQLSNETKTITTIIILNDDNRFKCSHSHLFELILYRYVILGVLLYFLFFMITFKFTGTDIAVVVYNFKTQSIVYNFTGINEQT